MAQVLFTNNASTTLASNITNVATSIPLATGTGALFPAITGSDFFYVTFVDGSNNREIVKVTARTTDTLTVTRAQEGTTAIGFTAGDIVELRITAAGLGNFVQDGDIGSTVQAYDVDTAKLDVAQSWTAQQTFKELKDTVYTITDGAAFEIDPANGSIQTITLTASRTPAATNFEAGQTVLLGVDDGSAYTLTWTTVNPTWVKVGGTASAPTLATSGYTWILFWKVGSTIYGTEVGKP